MSSEHETIAGGNDWNEAETQQCKGKLIALNLDQTQYRVIALDRYTQAHTVNKNNSTYTEWDNIEITIHIQTSTNLYNVVVKWDVKNWFTWKLHRILN